DESSNANDAEDVVLVAKDPRIEHGEASDEDGMFAVFLDFRADPHHAFIEIAKIYPFFPEAGSNQGGGIVPGDIEAMYPFVGIYGFFDRLDVVRSFGRTRVHNRVGGDNRSANADVLHLGMSQ